MDIWMSDGGEISCLAHAGSYLNGAAKARPKARSHRTPLGRWQLVTDADAEQWARDYPDLPPMACETCGARLPEREQSSPTRPARITAEPYDARQCPTCEVWVYTAAGPFAEDNDPTKTLADWLHWSREHMTGEQRADAEKPGAVVGFPFFDYNDQPVEAVLESASS